jgi:serine protease AprX
VAIRIPDSLVELVLFGPRDDRRQLQDSPILGDVWFAYAKAPDEEIDLLIAPFKGEHAGKVAAGIDDGLQKTADYYGEIAFLQGLVAARLKFVDLLKVVVPKTNWWIRNRRAASPAAEAPGKEGAARESQGHADDVALIQTVDQLVRVSRAKLISAIRLVFDSAESSGTATKHQRLQELPALQRLLALASLILWAGSFKPKAKERLPSPGDEASSKAFIWNSLRRDLQTKAFGEKLTGLIAEMAKNQTERPLVYEVSLNRPATPAVSKSVPAVKADAARTLFKVDCSEIAWAIVDSGIDGAHPAFRDLSEENAKKTVSRVRRSFDFQNFRRIVSLSNKYDQVAHKNAEILAQANDYLLTPLKKKQAVEDLKMLAADAEDERPIHWELVQKFVEIKPEHAPATNHGTHVAGILGASRRILETEPGIAYSHDYFDGMCPEISLYDFRVLGQRDEDTEFAIIAALQFIRHLNDRDRFLQINGVNLSLSIPHNVRNYACGRTPICEECERLVESGVVVVAAAGNHGYKSFQTTEGSFDSYAAFSITDPGNSDLVLTVGATHRFWPHTYGISFFSSRGPTGDGRQKPDLVAPGERIRAPFPGGEWGDLDGTSMAAPHASGAAAMLMARYTELIAQPRRIKRILCESATDLGRERSFQGNGMLDVLRAFQSI